MTACALPKYGCLSKEVTVENLDHSEAKEVPFILPRKNNSDSDDDDDAEVSLIKSMLLPLYDVHYMMYLPIYDVPNQYIHDGYTSMT